MIIDWIAAIVALTGVYFIGRKNKYGFLICAVSGVIWCCVALSTGVYGLLLEVVLLFILNIYNFNKWRKEEKRKNNELDR